MVNMTQNQIISRESPNKAQQEALDQWNTKFQFMVGISDFAHIMSLLGHQNHNKK